MAYGPWKLATHLSVRPETLLKSKIEEQPCWQPAALLSQQPELGTGTSPAAWRSGPEQDPGGERGFVIQREGVPTCEAMVSFCWGHFGKSWVMHGNTSLVPL